MNWKDTFDFIMSNCFKWIEFASTLCTTFPGQIEGMVENKDLGSALDSYFEVAENTGGNNNGADSYEARNKLKEIFKIVAGEDRLISWMELKEIMDNALQRDLQMEALSQSTVRSMISLMDKGRIGKLGVKEFINLWDYVQNWKTAFLNVDVNSQGYLSAEETKNALSTAGLNVSDKVINSLTIRYGDQERRFTFEDYLLCAIKIKNMTDLFKSREQNKRITISIAEFVEKSLYC